MPGLHRAVVAVQGKRPALVEIQGVAGVAVGVELELELELGLGLGLGLELELEQVELAQVVVAAVEVVVPATPAAPEQVLREEEQTVVGIQVRLPKLSFRLPGVRLWALPSAALHQVLQRRPVKRLQNPSPILRSTPPSTLAVVEPEGTW